MSVLSAIVVFGYALAAMGDSASPAVETLSKEVAGKGWIAYSARTANGDWDVFLCRPDGSHVQNITNTPETEEAAPRFSPDGKRLLFRRIALGTEINHDLWGFQGRLVIANANGSAAVDFGGDGEYPWASWTPDGTGLVCLTKQGIHFVEIATREEVKRIPRSGIYQQLFLSPDGRWLCGTGNHQGTSWTVVRMSVETGEVNPVRINQNCTPDWAPDSQRVIFSSRPPNQPANKGYGYTQLWIADGDGQNARLVYGEDGYHIYGGTLSPDGLYVLFTKSPMDGGASEKGGAPIHLMRLSEAPIIEGPSPDLRKLHPVTNSGPVLTLPTGWEPSWTYNDIGAQE